MTHVVSVGQSEPTNNMTEISIFRRELCGVDKQEKFNNLHQSANIIFLAVETDLLYILGDITGLDSLLHLECSGGIGKDRMLAG